MSLENEERSEKHIEKIREEFKNRVCNAEEKTKCITDWENDAVLSKGRVLLISEMPFQWSGGEQVKNTREPV